LGCKQVSGDSYKCRTHAADRRAKGLSPLLPLCCSSVSVWWRMFALVCCRPLAYACPSLLPPCLLAPVHDSNYHGMCLSPIIHLSIMQCVSCNVSIMQCVYHSLPIIHRACLGVVCQCCDMYCNERRFIRCGVGGRERSW